MLRWLRVWRRRGSWIRREAYALYLAARDPRTPRPAKVLALLVAAYALSPIDLIPDPIPVLGHLDDLLLIPLGLWVVRRMTPAEVWVDARARAGRSLPAPPPASRKGKVIAVFIWVLVAVLIVSMLARHYQSQG